MSTTAEKELTGKQARLLEELLLSPTVADAARKAGMSTRQAFRLMRLDESFRAAFKRSKSEAIQQAGALASGYAAGSIEVLWEVACNKAAPASARVAACSRILDLCTRMYETETVVERLEAVEAILEERK